MDKVKKTSPKKKKEPMGDQTVNKSGLDENSDKQQKTPNCDCPECTASLGEMLTRLENLHSKVPLVYKKIHEIMSTVGGVEKKGKVSFNTTNYTFQTAEDLVKAIKPKMIESGLIMFPIQAVKEPHDPERENLVQVKITYRLVAVEDGSYVDIPVLGAGADKGDKAVYKANTGAYKYGLKQTFMIETGEDDYDKEASEKAPASSKQYLATGNLRGKPYIKQSGIAKQTGNSYTIWKPEDKKDKTGDVFWDDQRFKAAGGIIDGEDSQENTKEVEADDLPF